MNITSTGDNLSILIPTEYSIHDDWMAFSAWYSLSKNLPDAQVAILCLRGIKDGHLSFGWPVRCGVNYFQHEGLSDSMTLLNRLKSVYVGLNQKLINQPVLVLPPETVCANSFSTSDMSLLNQSKIKFGLGFGNKSLMYFNNQSMDQWRDFLSQFIGNGPVNDDEVLSRFAEVFGEAEVLDDLMVPSQSKNMAAFVNYAHSDGDFTIKDWKEKYNVAPFNFATSFFNKQSNSTNERRLIDFWTKLRLVYEMVR